MSNFQLPIFQAILITLSLSTILNFSTYKLSKNFTLKKNNYEKRLSNNFISPFGGVACSLSFLLSTRLIGKAGEDFLFIGLFAFIISLLGIIDDIYNLRWYIKLFFQIISVLYPLVYLNLFLNFESFFGLNFNNYLNFLFSVIWIITIINSINFIDNMDGLAAVVAGTICLQVAFLTNYLNQYKLTDISLLLFATIIGFFIFNYPPAKLYLGDSGSLFIGYCLGFISIIFNWIPASTTVYTSFLNPMLLFFTIPLLDFIIVISHRIKKGVSPTTGGTDHISHRFLALGFNETKVLSLFIIYSIMLFTLILVSIISSKFIGYGVLIIFFAIFIITFFKISKMKILE
tara:strand:- start:183 stop:1217 length:1035 start_codon:yes stop_codon:yes gene_type:complete